MVRVRKKNKLQFIPSLDKKYQTTFLLLTKMAIVAWASITFAGLMNDVISKYVICLIFGVLAAEIGFLERKPLNKAGSFGYLILALMA